MRSQRNASFVLRNGGIGGRGFLNRKLLRRSKQTKDLNPKALPEHALNIKL